jgi:hypothetical protein
MDRIGGPFERKRQQVLASLAAFGRQGVNAPGARIEDAMVPAERS